MPFNVFLNSFPVSATRLAKCSNMFHTIQQSTWYTQRRRPPHFGSAALISADDHSFCAVYYYYVSNFPENILPLSARRCAVHLHTLALLLPTPIHPANQSAIKCLFVSGEFELVHTSPPERTHAHAHAHAHRTFLTLKFL